MSVVKSASTVALIAVLTIASFVAGRHTAPRLQVFDLKTGQFVPLVAPNGAQIFVASPEGTEPGVYAAHTKDGKQILILPPSIIQSQSQDDQPQQQNQTKHQEPEQSGGERLDRASL